ncbi:hypothetical protein ACN3XK_57145 [Actinomadura welshii]
MTERGPFPGTRGAPDPAEPSDTGDCGAPASRPPAAASPADLGEVRRTDAIFESLAARRGPHAGSASRSHAAADIGRPRPAEDADPAVRLLHALITDVDDPGPERGATPEPASPPPPGPGSGPRRRGPRTIVALGVAGAVLASTGVAAAGGGAADHSSTAAPVPRPTADTSEDAERTVHADTDTGTYERPRTPARPAPEPSRSAPAPAASSEDPGDRPEADRPRTRFPFPFGPNPRHPAAPTITVQSAPPPEADTPPKDDDIRRKLEDLQKRAKKHMDDHGRPRHRHEDD